MSGLNTHLSLRALVSLLYFHLLQDISDRQILPNIRKSQLLKLHSIVKILSKEVLGYA